MTDRAFPVISATTVTTTAAFFEQLGFIASVADPDGNPVAIATAPPPSPKP